MDNTAFIPMNVWRKYGYRLTQWIDGSLGEDCYKIKFSKYVDGRVNVKKPVKIVFDSLENYIMFKMKMGDYDQTVLL